MNELVTRSHFVDTGNPQRESENFQHHVFKNISFENSAKPVSFFRSDFRGAHFDTVRFYRNDLRRIDILDATVLNSSFSECRLDVAELDNSFFGKTLFASNLYDSTSIKKCVFDECQFTQEKFIKTDVRQCSFNGSRIRDCIFEMAIFDDVRFTDCALERIDISNMTATNFYFVNTRFDDVTIDLDYLATYRFRSGLPGGLKYKYRGQVITLDLKAPSVLHDFTSHFLKTERYYEFFNLMLLINSAAESPQPLAPVFRTVLSNIEQLSNDLVRRKQIDQMFSSLEFYFGSSVISFADYLQMLRALEQRAIGSTAKDKFLYRGHVEYLKDLVLSASYSYDFIGSIKSDVIFSAEMVLEESEPHEAMRRVELLCETVAEMAGSYDENGMPFKITGWRRGSITVEMIGYSAFFFLLLKIVKEVAQTSVSVAIAYTMGKKAIGIVRSATSAKELRELERLQIVRTAITPLQAAGLKDLLNTVKELKLYVDTPADRN